MHRYENIIVKPIVLYNSHMLTKRKNKKEELIHDLCIYSISSPLRKRDKGLG